MVSNYLWFLQLYLWFHFLGSLVSWAQFTVKNPTIHLSPCKLCIRRINSATGKLPTSTIKCTLVVITMHLPRGIYQESQVNVHHPFPTNKLYWHSWVLSFYSFPGVYFTFGWVFAKSHGQLALHNWLMQPNWVSRGEICLLFTVGAVYCDFSCLKLTLCTPVIWSMVSARLRWHN